MVVWSNLAKFLEFEVLACFKVFKLAPVATNPAPAVSTIQAEQLQRLAAAFKVDSGT